MVTIYLPQSCPVAKNPSPTMKFEQSGEEVFGWHKFCMVMGLLVGSSIG
jgi:hypothetical protein